MNFKPTVLGYINYTIAELKTSVKEHKDNNLMSHYLEGRLCSLMMLKDKIVNGDITN